jgi:AcrR family transcriptional regulator
MGRRRQVSDRQISVAAREVFLDRGPKAPVALVAKKLGVSTATLFQRTGSKQQLMLMALQHEGTTPAAELARGLQPGIPVLEQLSHVLIGINQYLGAVISGSLTLRAACIAADLPEPTPYRLRELLAEWLQLATAANLLAVSDAATTADVLIGALESRHIHAYMQQQRLTSQQHRDYIRAMLDVVLPSR